MSCNCGTVPSTFSIFLGNEKVMNMKVLYGDTGDPVDLTSCSEIDVALPNADGTFTHLTKTDGAVTIAPPDNLGKFQVAIDPDTSEALNVGEFQNVDVAFTITGRTFTVRYAQAISVFQNSN